MALKEFDVNGYAVLRGIVPAELCVQIVKLFRRDVKGNRNGISRSTSGMNGAGKYDANGFDTNRVAEIQSISNPDLEGFVEKSMNLLTSGGINTAIRTILGQEALLGQTFYFESNRRTPAHRDADYFPFPIDSSITVWVALEDIHPGAGRLYVCPGSHRLKLPDVGNPTASLRDEHRYLVGMKHLINDMGLECRAPAMGRGDAILFDGATIHGSLATSVQLSRNSITGFFFPSSSDYHVPVKTINGVDVVVNPTAYMRI